MEQQKIESLAETLAELQEDALLEVLRLVFERRTPFPIEAAWHKSRYFLGLASSILNDESDPEAGKEVWSEWEVSAAAYPDLAEYGAWKGPDWGFAEHGVCHACHATVVGIVKHGICPICAEHVHMT